MHNGHASKLIVITQNIYVVHHIHNSIVLMILNVVRVTRLPGLMKESITPRKIHIFEIEPIRVHKVFYTYSRPPISDSFITVNVSTRFAFMSLACLSHFTNYLLLYFCLSPTLPYDIFTCVSDVFIKSYYKILPSHIGMNISEKRCIYFKWMPSYHLVRRGVLVPVDGDGCCLWSLCLTKNRLMSQTKPAYAHA